MEKEENTGSNMAARYINRQHDEEIINLVRTIMNNGTGKAETANEHILIKLMQIRNTPMANYKFAQEKVDFNYNLWLKDSCAPINKTGVALTFFKKS